MLWISGQLARGEVSAAKATVQAMLRQKPDWVPALLLFSRVLIEDGQDWEGAEKVLRRVLQPNQREAEHNLKVLLNRMEKS